VLVTPGSFRPLLAPVAHPAPRVFAFRGAQILIRERDFALPDSPVCRAFGLDVASALPVGMLGEAYCCATWLPEASQPVDGYVFKGLRSLWGRWDEAELAVAGRAFQIADWARTNRFCGACGGPMSHVPGERAMKCGACGNTSYPRIAPAMMTLVKKGDAILLARNIAVPPGGRMSALAGFLEPGESVEDAIHREVREEVGVEVKDLRYFASQSWPFPHSLMIAFTAEYAGGELRCDPAEIAEALWFCPGDKLPGLPPAQSISRALIEANLPK
jgi:NAD+ diphosphatase